MDDDFRAQEGSRPQGYYEGLTDSLSFHLSEWASRKEATSIVPILTRPVSYLIQALQSLPDSGDDEIPTPDLQSTTVLSVALSGFPTPSELCSWEQILDFKAEFHDKLWHLRRFLHTLSTKTVSEAEIRDDLEWTLNEYRRAMEIHRMKASQSFIDIFVISPLELIENLVKFNWSKIAKGALAVTKKKTDLIEAEMKAPGRECAYIFDAHRRFR